MSAKLTYYPKKEEILNVATHALGFVLAIVGFVWMLIDTTHSQNTWAIVSTSIYGMSMILLYLASTAYHMSYKKNVRRILNKLDHGAIYLLIAGTYTPFCLIAMRQTGGWYLFAAVWVLALAGVVFKLKYTGRFNKLSTLLYVLMGWLVVFMIQPLIDAVSTPSLWFLVSGGLAYSLGAIFYLLPRLPYHHAIFHVFVLIGSVLHFISVLLIL